MTEKTHISLDASRNIEHYQISDTHLEDIMKDFRTGKEQEFLSRIPFPKPRDLSSYNILFMLGDIVEFKKTFVASLILKHISSFFDLVLYVPGNHCYYNSSIKSVEEKIRSFMSDTPNFHLLQNETLTLSVGDRQINYIGSTLWTDFGKCNSLFNEAGSKIDNYTYAFSDYKKIALTSKPYVNLKPAHVLGLHKESVNYIEQELNRLSGQENIVLTHHSPSYKSATHFAKSRQGLKLSRMMKGHLKQKHGCIFKIKSAHLWNTENLDRYTPLFCNNLDSMIKKYSPIFWGHGHLHERRYYRIKKSIISCNPTGYLCEQINPRIASKPTFAPVLTIKSDHRGAIGA